MKRRITECVEEACAVDKLSKDLEKVLCSLYRTLGYFGYSLIRGRRLRSIFRVVCLSNAPIEKISEIDCEIRAITEDYVLN